MNSFELKDCFINTVPQLSFSTRLLYGKNTDYVAKIATLKAEYFNADEYKGCLSIKSYSPNDKNFFTEECNAYMHRKLDTTHVNRFYTNKNTVRFSLFYKNIGNNTFEVYLKFNIDNTVIDITFIEGYADIIILNDKIVFEKIEGLERFDVCNNEISINNLIKNPKLTNLDDWNLIDDGITKETTTIKHNGNNSILLRSSVAGALSSINLTEETVEGEYYTLSFYALGLNDPAEIHAELFGGEGKADFKINSTDSSNWIRVVHTFIGKGNNKLYIGLNTIGGCFISEPQLVRGTNVPYDLTMPLSYMFDKLNH